MFKSCVPHKISEEEKNRRSVHQSVRTVARKNKNLHAETKFENDKLENDQALRDYDSFIRDGSAFSGNLTKSGMSKRNTTMDHERTHSGNFGVDEDPTNRADSTFSLMDDDLEVMGIIRPS